MRLLLISGFLMLGSIVFSQDEFMVWTELGVERKIIKRLDAQFELNTRFDRYGVATLFPQIGFKYKVKKWFKPSIEYRFIVDRNKYGNYKSSNRLNFNADFDKEIERLSLGARIRYQYAFDRIGATESYNPDFDMAVRVKPSIEYDIDNFILSPKFSAEFFYNPTYGGPYSPGFSKVRLAAGFGLDIKGPHDFDFKYQLDKKFHDYADGLRHVIAFSYSYTLDD